MTRYNRDRFRRPELFFEEMVRKAVRGDYLERDESVPFLYRAVVVAVDVEGGKLENPDGTGGVANVVAGKRYDFSARMGPSNPPNSVKARVVSDGFDKFSKDEDLRVFWPFFPESISLPVKPGEYVYVLFEDSMQQHGLWVSKVSGHVGVNYAPGKDFYKSPDESALSSKFDDTRDVSRTRVDTTEDAAETKPGNKLSSLFGVR